MTPIQLPGSIDQAAALLRQGGYVADRPLVTALYLSLVMHKPLFLEGEAGVGKTEIAKVLAQGLGRELIRLQCYEGLDAATAVYEWNYPRQMMAIRLAEASGAAQTVAQDIYGPDYLIERPLLRALRPLAAGPPVLLIDELDRADEPFEAFLLEILSDFQVTVPEIGTITAAQPPLVVMTSNRTREIHDAIKRRCLYHWVDYPTAERERAILATKVPEAGAVLATQIVSFVQMLRGLELFKPPGIAETLDWARALQALHARELDSGAVNDTLGVVLKYQDDIARVRGEVATRGIAEARRAAAG
ncbi:MAG: MoxR family ATPase [Rhodospirillaceae bacterium]|nr:MoxR family ATPase [Rhodospirillaceae bacterium]